MRRECEEEERGMINETQQIVAQMQEISEARDSLERQLRTVKEENQLLDAEKSDAEADALESERELVKVSAELERVESELNQERLAKDRSSVDVGDVSSLRIELQQGRVCPQRLSQGPRPVGTD